MTFNTSGHLSVIHNFGQEEWTRKVLVSSADGY